MPADRRRQLFLIAVLMPLTALAEMAMVAAMVPLLGSFDWWRGWARGALSPWRTDPSNPGIFHRSRRR
jgi:hypothetical protein